MSILVVYLVRKMKKYLDQDLTRRLRKCPISATRLELEHPINVKSLHLLSFSFNNLDFYHLEDKYISTCKSIPGPGTYTNPLSLSTKGRYPSSSYKYTNSLIFQVQHVIIIFCDIPIVKKPRLLHYPSLNSNR